MFDVVSTQHPHSMCEIPSAHHSWTTLSALVSALYRSVDQFSSRPTWHPTCRLPPLAMEHRSRLTVRFVEP
jgi:hypothetical protein